jgi:hypothetical protein
MNPNLGPPCPNRNLIPLLVAAFLAASGAARLPQAMAADPTPVPGGASVVGADSLGALDPPGASAGSLFTGFS